MRQSRPLGSARGGAQQCPRLLGPRRRNRSARPWGPGCAEAANGHCGRKPFGSTLGSHLLVGRLHGLAERIHGANREFRKMIAQGGHVTPSIESNPLTACTRIGNLRFLEAAEGSGKNRIYNRLQSLKQPRYKVEMHNCVEGHEFARLEARRARGCAARVAADRRGGSPARCQRTPARDSRLNPTACGAMTGALDFVA